MEYKGMISEIKSKYILLHIYNFIKDRHFIQKLFIHSENYKNRLDINYSFCYEKYLDKLHFNLNDFLYKNEEEYEKDVLKKEYDYFLIKNDLNKVKFEKMLYEVINNNNERYEKDGKKYINIDSPIFEILSKTNVFDKIFTIYISQKNIDEYKLKNDYIKIFNKLNNSNIKYKSIYYIFNEKTKIDYLKEININFNNIRELEIIYNNEMIKNDYTNNSINIINLFKNLEQLILRGNENIIKLLENVNLKELRELVLSQNKISDIKLLEKVEFYKLEIVNLNINKISDINSLSNVKFKKLKELYLYFNKISDIKVLGNVKFDKLEKLDLNYNEISDINILENANFKELKELYLSKNKISDIQILEKVKFDKLEKLYLSGNQISDINSLEKANFK